MRDRLRCEQLISLRFRKELLEEIVTSVVDEFAVGGSADGLSARFSPQTFQRRKEILLEADKRLDHIQVRMMATNVC